MSRRLVSVESLRSALADHDDWCESGQGCVADWVTEFQWALGRRDRQPRDTRMRLNGRVVEDVPLPGMEVGGRTDGP